MTCRPGATEPSSGAVPPVAPSGRPASRRSWLPCVRCGHQRAVTGGCCSRQGECCGEGSRVVPRTRGEPHATGDDAGPSAAGDARQVPVALPYLSARVDSLGEQPREQTRLSLMCQRLTRCGAGRPSAGAVHSRCSVAAPTAGVPEQSATARPRTCRRGPRTPSTAANGPAPTASTCSRQLLLTAAPREVAAHGARLRSGRPRACAPDGGCRSPR